MKNKLGNSKVCKTLIKHGEIMVNGDIVTDTKYQINKTDVINYGDIIINPNPDVYYMMNKPANYICANKDKYYPCVIDLIDRDDCYCLGRLDKDTTGLLLITNNRSLSKKLLLPQNHVLKKYYVTVNKPLKTTLIEIFKNGVVIDSDVKCHESKLEIIDDYHCYVTIDEGKYHQIKKMFLSCDNQVVELKRVSFGEIVLDESLDFGEYRKLDDSEIECLLKKRD